eukprot:TRINITY_DN7185_c0_g1_i1.p1 TRINITY_DN7185_c0_g1~~TRINITY_DN7185_c0_g1_i1.p1  ORF type:complete len:622 (-),score=122.32 TRINITY_DN7185_c0_g1_i1:318-2183(-)
MTELTELQHVIHMNEVEKLKPMLKEHRYLSLIHNTFSEARDYRGNDGAISFLHYAVYCDAFDCGELLLEAGGASLRDRPSGKGNTPRQVAERLYLDLFVSLFDEWVPPKVEAPPVARPSIRSSQPPPGGRSVMGVQRLSNRKSQGRSGRGPPPPVQNSQAPVRSNPYGRVAPPPMKPEYGQVAPERPIRALAPAAESPEVRLAGPTNQQPPPPHTIKNHAQILMGRMLALQSEGIFTDLAVSAHERAVPTHGFVLAARCRTLKESPNFLEAASVEAVTALVHYIYLDELPQLSSLSIPSLFELWGISMDLSLLRLEYTVRLWIRNSLTVENAVEVAQCMHDFGMFNEYLAVLWFVKANSVALKPKLIQHRELALSILRANEADYPQEALVLPESTLQQDLTTMSQQATSYEIRVQNKSGQSKVFRSQAAMLSSISPYWRQQFSQKSVIDHNTVLSLVTFKQLFVTYPYQGVLRFSAVDAAMILLHGAPYKLTDWTLIKQVCEDRISQGTAQDETLLKPLLSAIPAHILSRSGIIGLVSPRLAAVLAPPAPAAVQAPASARSSPPIERGARPKSPATVETPAVNAPTSEFDRNLIASPFVQQLLRTIQGLTDRVAELEAKGH